MRSWFLRARESFWFLPTVFGVAAVILALGLVELDRILQDDGIRSLPLVADLSATGGRAILAAIGGTMLAVAATSFSITISVLATTSSTYGPRLVRNFMADRGNQIVLATLTSTFLYALVVLRAVRTDQDESANFVPVVAVSFAVLLAVLDVAVLVYFIDHIASSVQVTTLQSRVLAELVAVIDLLYPEEATPSTPAPPEPGPDTIVEVFTAESSGYVQYVDIERLVKLATSHDVILHVVATPGEYVIPGQTIAQSLIDPGGPRRDPETDDDRDALSKTVPSAISIAAPRTPHQDLRYAARGLIEIGARGLASGSNDPYTAIAAIDALSAALVTLSTRPHNRGGYPDDDGRLRLVCVWPGSADVIADAMQAYRVYGIDHPLVVAALVEFVGRLEPVVSGDARRVLAEQTGALRDAYAATDPAAVDAAVVLDTLKAQSRQLSARRS